MKFSYIDELCAKKDAFNFSKETEELFLNSMIENYKFQLKNQPYIRYLAEKNKFHIRDIKHLEEVDKIPFLFVETMKLNSFCNFREEDLAMILTSSGTNGQKTQAFFDKGSLRRLEELALNAFDSIGFRSKTPVHYFLFSYDIKNAKNIGTSWSDEQILQLAPAISINWMIEWDKNKENFFFDSEKWAKKFVQLSKEAPVRLLGFPAFMYKMVEDIRRMYGKIQVKKESFVIAGGGWKNHLGKSMELKSFLDYMKENIGLEPNNIRDTYGMAEHGVPYCSCPEGHLHVPIYSKVLVRDPITLEKKNYGEEGLLQLLTPYNIAEANMSLLSTDIAILGKNCKCGIKGDYIKKVRRGGIKKHKGCAIKAQDILSKSK
ncbi:acyl-protein synthetase LuxE [Haloimpatiens massiliensis]|uniref:LuxE/PaaK family acyltransferase n=1 Tax=Haloimpatiens massiliensis TaxID=1658110 RepID=UPI000C82D3EF|nr:acyl-protein synthetase LuxE [Haloimpatiens massiliensis]